MSLEAAVMIPAAAVVVVEVESDRMPVLGGFQHCQCFDQYRG